MEKIQEVEKFYNKKVNYKILPRQKSDYHYILIIQKAQKLLGWKPRYTALNYILKTIKEYECLKEIQSNTL